MNKTDAGEILQKYVFDDEECIAQDMKDYNEALKMAIEALSAEAADVYKAHEEEHLNIVNRIKELQYAIAKTQTIVGEMVESAEAEPTETSTLGEKHQLSHGRLIDADELKKHLDNAWEELNDDGERKGVRLARWYLISAPTVDSTIDVVRCKDCRYRNGKVNRKGFEVCDATGMDITDNDFCSWGERREP